MNGLLKNMENLFCRKKILFLFALYGFFCGRGLFFAETDKDGRSAEKTVTVVTILNAEKTGNKKNELDGTDMIVLSGNVEISVQKGNVKTKISADTVNYNREKDMLYAEGSVNFSQEKGNKENEKVSAQTLLFNTATLEGIFDGGRVVQTASDSMNLPSGSTLIVASEIFGRDETGTVTFKNGSLTFCDENPPHWKIKASRIWLLPGDEFAFFNAFLYVGKVPVFYLPAFWYPKDELIFNPVFGFRQREGYFFQTTTYLFGRKPLSAYDVGDQYLSNSDSESSADESYYSFVKPSKLKVQERQGLMLHNLSEDYTGDTSNYAKIMADWYASLGYMVGFDISINPSDSKYFSKFQFNAALGVSNTIFEDGAAYSIYGLESGDIYKDSSSFLGMELPYRYQLNLTFELKKPLKLTLNLPLYSDPYFKTDFGKRTETMDWIDYLISNPNTETETDKDNDREKSAVTSFSWKLSGSYDIPLPEFSKPYLETLSISSFSSAVLFSSLQNTKIASEENDDGWATFTPERKFFYPSQVDPLKISGKISGTILSFGSSTKKTSTPKEIQFLSAPEEISEKTDADLQQKNIENLDEKQSDQQEFENQPDGNQIVQKNSDAENVADTVILDEKALPELAFNPPSNRNVGGLVYTLTYLILPVYNSEFAYSSTGISAPEDFDWKRLKSTMVYFKSPVTLTSKIGYKDSFLSVTDTFDFVPIYQNHPYLSKNIDYGGYTDSAAASIRKTDYAGRKLDLTNSNTVSIKPFYYTENFNETGISWNTTVKLIKTEFIGDADNPEWEYLTTDFTDEDYVTVHTLNAVLAATQHGGDFGQKFVFSSTLPPQVDKYYGTLTLKFPYTSLVMESGIKKTSSTDETWVKEPFKQSLTFKILDGKVSFTQSYTYNREDEYSDSFKYSCTVYDFQLAYTAKYTTGYDFDSDSGWVARSNKEFLPYSLSLSYSRSKKNFRYWKNRISWAPSLSSTLVYDFLRPTNSYFKFIPALTFEINEFLDIEFSASSRNDVIYRYAQNYLGPEAKIAGETNWLQDLIDSFRFDDENKRIASGFKLESFNVKVTHGLHDWDLSSQFKIEPRLVTESSGKKYYDYSPFFTVSVVWRPMPGMKTKIQDKYGDWELNP